MRGGAAPWILSRSVIALLLKRLISLLFQGDPTVVPKKYSYPSPLPPPQLSHLVSMCGLNHLREVFSLSVRVGVLNQYPTHILVREGKLTEVPHSYLHPQVVCTRLYHCDGVRVAVTIDIEDVLLQL